MKIIIEAEPKEIAALALELQGWQDDNLFDLTEETDFAAFSEEIQKGREEFMRYLREKYRKSD